jgi:hypothetical protein
MITSADILRKTGLKNAKTLARWAKRGLIPEPSIGTHPHGRGKVGYWPDWVLDRCVEIVKAQREGKSLNEIAMGIGVSHIETALKGVGQWQSIVEGLAAKQIPLPNTDIKVSVLDILRVEIVKGVEQSWGKGLASDAVDQALRGEGLMEHACQLSALGYNPVLVVCGTGTVAMPDFLVSHELSVAGAEASAQFIIPVLGALQRTFKRVGKSWPFEVKVTPGKYVVAQQDDVLLRYDVFHGGPIGFEIISETAQVLGHVTGWRREASDGSSSYDGIDTGADAPSKE